MSEEKRDSPIEVLLVEDDPADARLTRETLKESKHRLNITVAEDGEVAMTLLRREGEYEAAPRPDLILLDLTLPKKSGGEVLEELNADPEFVEIPVMILTSTEADQSRLSAFNIHPSRYCRKPLGIDRFDGFADRMDTLRNQPIRLAHPAQPSESNSSDRKRWWWPFG